MATMARVDSGLEGVVVADTVLSLVDGEGGRLVVRGHELADLVRTTRDGGDGFEHAAALLWDGFLPEGGHAPAVRDGLGRARVDTWRRVPAWLAATRHLSTVEAARAGLAALSDGGGSPHLRAAGALPVLIAAHLRATRDLAPVAPDPARSTAGDLLRMLRGTPASDAEAQALDAYLVTVADHGFNASTFTARVIASTRAGVVPAVVGALCALQGPLHGGAPGPVLDMLDAAAVSGDVAGWIDAALARGERLMGFGHRIYKVRDPRADVLRDVAAALPHTAGRLALAREVEAAALAALRRHKPGQRLDTNVEFYTAVVLEAVGIPREAFTAVFAAGRVAGWIAHACEQERTGRIIRPQSHYTGPMPG